MSSIIDCSTVDTRPVTLSSGHWEFSVHLSFRFFSFLFFADGSLCSDTDSLAKYFSYTALSQTHLQVSGFASRTLGSSMAYAHVSPE